MGCRARSHVHSRLACKGSRRKGAKEGVSTGLIIKLSVLLHSILFCQALRPRASRVVYESKALEASLSRHRGRRHPAKRQGQPTPRREPRSSCQRLLHSQELGRWWQRRAAGASSQGAHHRARHRQHHTIAPRLPLRNVAPRCAVRGVWMTPRATTSFFCGSLMAPRVPRRLENADAK